MITSFLDDLEPIPWEDFAVASARTKAIVRRLAGDRPLLKRLVYDVESKRELLTMCEHHQLLDKLVVYDALDRGFRIRVHLSTNEHLDRPHDHRFSFTSLILRGSYRHIWYSSPRIESEQLAIDQMTPLFVTSESEGACYTLHHSVLHSTVTTPDTVSLVVRGPAEKDRSVISDRGSPRIVWRYGERDESESRRSNVQLSLEAYLALRSKLEQLDII